MNVSISVKNSPTFYCFQSESLFYNLDKLKLNINFYPICSFSSYLLFTRQLPRKLGGLTTARPLP